MRDEVGTDVSSDPSFAHDIFLVRQQNGDELPGTRCRPTAHSILVRFYGFEPWRSGWAALP